MTIKTEGIIPEEDVDPLVAEIARTLHYRTPIFVPLRGRTYVAETRSVDGQITWEDAKQFADSFGLHLSMLIGSPPDSADPAHQDVDVVVGIDAQPDEQPWRSLRDSVESAADQLEGKRPGLIAIHYSDPVPDVEALGPDDRQLDKAVDERLHIHPNIGGISISSDPAHDAGEADAFARMVFMFRRKDSPEPFAELRRLLAEKEPAPPEPLA